MSQSTEYGILENTMSADDTHGCMYITQTESVSID